MTHPTLTPVQVPRAPTGWQLNPDQAAQVARDPRLHRLSNDMLYLYFNQPKSAATPEPTNVFSEYLQKAMRYLGVPDDWYDQAMSWHPMNTIQRASDALGNANDRMNGNDPNP